MTPYPGDPDDVVVDTTLQSKGPARVIPAYRMQSTANNGLKFQPGSPLEPDQGDLFDDEE